MLLPLLLNNLLTTTAVTITISAGSYASTGNDSSLLKNSVVQAENTSLVLSGSNVNFLRGYVLTANNQGYSISGNSQNFVKGYKTTADSSGYEITGNEVNLIRSYNILIDNAQYTLTGQQITATVGSLNVTPIEYQSTITKVISLNSAVDVSIELSGEITSYVFRQSSIFITLVEENSIITTVING